MYRLEFKFPLHLAVPSVQPVEVASVIDFLSEFLKKMFSHMTNLKAAFRKRIMDLPDYFIEMFNGMMVRK